MLKEKIDAGNATEEINSYIAKYYELIKDPESGIEDKMLPEGTIEEVDSEDLSDSEIDRTDN